jgi:hypothetical protein
VAVVLYTPLFETVARGIGVSEVEFFAILEYYSMRLRSGSRITGAGGARQ